MKIQITFCSTNTRRYFIISCLALLVAILPATSYCQDESDYDEMIISLTSRLVGNAEIPAIIYKNKAYLPVSDFFNFLKLSNSLVASGDSIFGFILNEQDVFSINRKSNYIRYKNSVTPLTAGSIFYKSEDYYLQAEYFTNVFGLNCDFQFRSLSLDFDTKLDLPFLKEQRQQQMRLQLKKGHGNGTADTVLTNKFSFLRPGMMDWDLASTQGRSTSYSARVGLGFGLLGGEANFYLNYTSNQSLLLKNQQYYWRHVNNDARFIKQVNAGRVSSQGSLSSFALLNGIQVSNASTSPKKSFGSFRLNEVTEPNWIVELYVNDMMVDYTKADANGNFSFEVPMIYGGCKIQYKFYGPFGEVKETTQQINIPYTFLQPGKVEYTLTAGITGDGDNNKFSRLHVNYGLGKRITIGSAVEYNSQPGIKHVMPTLTASLRLGQGLIVSAEHAPAVVSRANANYRFAGNVQVDASYIKYAPLQNVIRTASLEEKKMSVSVPFRFKKWSGFSRFTYNEIRFYKSTQRFAEWMQTASYNGITANLSTFTHNLQPFDLQSRLTLSFRAPHAVRVNPQLTYHYQSGDISGWKLEGEKFIGTRSQLKAFYEYSKLSGSGTLGMSWQHNLSFMIYGGHLSKQKQTHQASQYAGGSLHLKDGVLKASSQKNVGMGGVIIEAFLDANFNGKKDKDEVLVKAPGVKIDGGQARTDKKSLAVTLDALEPFETYVITLDPRNFENPSWRINHKIYQLTVEPNVYKKLSIPVQAAGEVAGYVYESDSLSISKNGMGKIRLNIYDTDKKMVASVYSQGDGYFSYMGLKPGRYSVSPDEETLNKFKMAAGEKKYYFDIRFNADGDYVDSLEIVLRKN